MSERSQDRSVGKELCNRLKRFASRLASGDLMIKRPESDSSRNMAMSSFGQENCANCGWSGGNFKDRSSVRFVGGDAVCPECGELCDYYDYRDEDSLLLATKIANELKSLGQTSGDFAGVIETIREILEAEKP